MEHQNDEVNLIKPRNFTFQIRFSLFHINYPIRDSWFYDLLMSINVTTQKAKIKQNHRVPDDIECDGYWWSAWMMMLILNCWMKNTNIPSKLTRCVPKSCIAPPKSSVRKKDRIYHRNQLLIRYFQHSLPFQNRVPVVLREEMSLFSTSPNSY